MAPLPSPGNVIKVRLFWQGATGNEFSSRFFLEYTGGPAGVVDLDSLCGNIASDYVSYLLPWLSDSYTFVAVDAEDLSSDTGNSGQALVSHTGALSGDVPDNCAINISFEIARRYRGGKPKIFLPPAGSGNLGSPSSWNSSTVTGVQTNWGDFMTSVLGGSYGTFALVNNVNVSYYKGFTVFITPSGRARNIPTLRATPVLDLITNHTVRSQIGSQRRRRSADVTP